MIFQKKLEVHVFGATLLIPCSLDGPMGDIPLEKMPKILHGKQTELALSNFQISGRTLQREFVLAQLMTKKASALANTELGLLEEDIAQSIVQACDMASEKDFLKHFKIDVYQAGAGTSQNMNVNEVVACLATRLLQKDVHPNDHVNMLQSTNDTIPTAAQIACLFSMNEKLVPSIEGLFWTFKNKAREYSHLVKSGRTHMQDAVIMEWKDVFNAWSSHLEVSLDRLKYCERSLLEVPLGGNAVGNGANAPANYRISVVNRLREVTGMDVIPSKDAVALTENPVSFLHLASSLSETAVALSRISSDVIVLSSGPRTGLQELLLKPLQAGSSFMPGKVNPVMAEMLVMACCQVQGHTHAVKCGMERGMLELNVTMPMMAWNLLDAINILSRAVSSFDKKCAVHMMVNEDKSRESAYSSLGGITALVPVFGYDECARLAGISRDLSAPLDEVVAREHNVSIEQARLMLRGERFG